MSTNLDELKKEFISLTTKLNELSEDELKEVTGGKITIVDGKVYIDPDDSMIDEVILHIN